MAITVGNVLAEGEVTNASAITLTLSEAVPVGTEEEGHGLAIAIATREDFATVAEQEAWSSSRDEDDFRPAVSDNADPDAGPYGLGNIWTSWLSFQIPSALAGAEEGSRRPYASVRISVGGELGRALLTWRGISHYLVRAPLSAGAPLTVSLAHSSGPVPTWMGVRVHRVDGVQSDQVFPDPYVDLSQNEWVYPLFSDPQEPSITSIGATRLIGDVDSTAFDEVDKPLGSGIYSTKRDLWTLWTTRSTAALPSWTLPGVFTNLTAPHGWVRSGEGAIGYLLRDMDATITAAQLDFVTGNLGDGLASYRPGPSWPLPPAAPLVVHIVA